MPTDIDPRIAPSLHPENVKTLDGYDEATATGRPTNPKPMTECGGSRRLTQVG
jgi:hypothetical protein